MNLEKWLQILPDELRRIGLIKLGLDLGSGLPTAVRIDPERCLQLFERTVDIVAAATARAFRTARNHPDQKHMTDAEFRILSMVTTLRRDLRIHYNMRCMEGEYDGRDSCNVFAHGILSGRGGTCASLPVLYVAIGRELGYPMYLARAREHLFCRWDDGCRERFNIEATTHGYNTHDDSHYLKGVYGTGNKPHSPLVVACGYYLTNLTLHQELAMLIADRGLCLFENLKIERSIPALRLAHQMHFGFPGYHEEWGLALIFQELFGELNGDHTRLDESALDGRDDLQPKFSASLLARAREEIHRLKNNWMTRDPYPLPDFTVPLPRTAISSRNTPALNHNGA